ncbi:MAG: hypothetical protein U0452_10305 [Anaerolineae bacterium]
MTVTPEAPGAEVTQAITTTRKRIRRIILTVTLVPALLFGIMFLAAIVLALIDIQSAGDAVRMIRDLMIVFIAFELALIFVSVSILLVQVSRLLNLLTEEVAPLLDATQETVQTAQNTVEFAGRNVLNPFIELSAFFTTVMSLLASGFGLRRAYTRANKPKRDNDAG